MVAPGYSTLLQGTPLLHRMLLYCSGYHIYCRGCNLLQGMQSTAGDANNYPSGYHTNTGYMAFELSHISYHMAPEHAMLLQGTPRCSRVLHCSIGCYSTAADTTSTAGDAIYCRGCNLLQGMQTITPADTTLIQGIWPLNYLTYHTIWLQNMLCCSRVLHCSRVLQDATLLQRIPHLLQGMQYLLQGMQYLLQGMQTITPADTTLIQGI